MLRAAASGALGAGTINDGNGGNGSTSRLELVGGIALNNPISLPGRNTNTAAVENISGSNTLSGGMTLGVGGSNYWLQSDAGLLTLSNSSAISLAAGLTGTRTVTLLGAGNGLISGSLSDGNSGTMALTMNGSGTWTLSGTNTYTGGTNVFGGELVVTTPQGIEDGTNLFVGSAASLFAPIVQSAQVPSTNVASVPEPGSLALIAAGILTTLVVIRRGKRFGAVRER